MAQNVPPNKRNRGGPNRQGNYQGRGGHRNNNAVINPLAAGPGPLMNNTPQTPDALLNRLAYLENLVVNSGIVNNQGAIPRPQQQRPADHRRGNGRRQRDSNTHQQQQQAQNVHIEGGGAAGNVQHNMARGNHWRHRQNNSQQTQNFQRANRERFGSRESINRDEGAAENVHNNRGARRERNPCGVGFKFIESLYEKDPEEILMAVSTNKGFSIRLDQELTEDYIVILLKLLSKMCGSAFNECKIEVITLFCKEKFIDQLIKYIATLPIQTDKDKRRNHYFWNNPDEFWNSLHVMCSTVIELIPSTAIDVIPKVISSTMFTIKNFEATSSNVIVSKEIVEKFKKLQKKLTLCIEEIEKKKVVVEVQSNRDDVVEMEPPNDFREMTVYPTSADILSEETPFLRKNIINRKYKNVNEYLDIQFRLLREDFVGPLREGIADYRKHVNKKIHTVKVHPKVQFMGSHSVKDQVGYKVQFESNLKKLSKSLGRLENSKRFMFGALVCFTRDNFVSLIFGKIIDRDIKMLGKGLIIVNFDNDEAVQSGVDYIMVECNVYFEPYYHVLKALQSMDVDNFPMERYIIHIDPEIRPPGFLDHTSIYVINKFNVELFNPFSWPGAKALELNRTQYDAFKSGIMNEFSIIQGPPGTGKTYLGLKIAKTLIKNRKAWYRQCPILVVCYTNHALDQFLEGLLDSTKDIVRVGGQSKSDKLKPFSIIEKRRTMLKCGMSTSRLLAEKRNALLAVGKEVKDITAELESLDEFNTVMDFNCFSTVDVDFPKSWFATAKGEDIEKWLLGGRTEAERESETRKARIEGIMKRMEKTHEGNNDDGYDFYDDGLLDLEEQREQERRLDYDDLELDLDGPVQPLSHLIKVSALEEELNKKVLEMNTLELTQEMTVETAAELERLEDECFALENKLVFIKEKLKLGKTQEWQKPANVNFAQPHFMPSDFRWQLYFHLVGLYRNRLNIKLEALGEQYRTLNRQYAEVRNIEDVNLMKQMLVVGMTTTGAARLQTSLQALKSQIVIVEEAAEVLESHIVTSLTSHCSQLILIGDHQQLRPSTANYNMEMEMKLGISLFERMVRNNLHCSVLGVQHRMRPEISCLIRPAIYPHLEDHASVLEFPPIRGIDHSLYFIDHRQAEDQAGDSSKENKHEAQFLIRLARHLILNGYEPHEITILAAYLGQFYTIRSEKMKYNYLLKEVRIAVLDNYQGEECKIILLSLVRNNNNNSIGFLKIENRVCVALSRAKEGMYIMGNMDLLVNNSNIWKKIKPVFVEQNSLGEYLTLRCQVHQNRTVKVKSVDDFDRCPEGGCDEVCGMILNCGHICQAMCHIQNRDHQDYRCKQPCKKLLCDDPDHKCLKLCYKECGPCWYKVHRVLSCGHEHDLECHIVPEEYKCPIPVPVKLDCGHETMRPCHLEKIKCPFPCDIRLECGHACIRPCHINDDPDHLQYKCRKNCAKLRAGCTSDKKDHTCRKLCFEDCEPCTITVRKGRTVCPHFFDVFCCEDVDELTCEKPCKAKLPCGHICQNKCSEPCGNCQLLAIKTVERCGHEVKVKCCLKPTRKDCRGKCIEILPCGHQCDQRCFEPCTQKCPVLVNSPVQAACGHAVKIPCYLAHRGVASDDMKLLQNCRHPCNATLECKHKCLGTCGECSQGRVHKTCGEKCGVILVCGHECPIPCRQACQPCTQPCEYRCKHSKCKKKCGTPCTNCEEPCPRVCEHTRCSARCGEKCTVKPCTEPCQKKIPKCGHPCVGFCGDVCPPLCRICDKEELQEIYLGFEADDDARYVFLLECKHVIESQGMDMWLSQKGDADKENEIKVKRCPKCNTRLTSTPRYIDYVKEAMEDVTNIKRKFYGLQRENESKREQLRIELKLLINNCLHIFPYSAKLKRVLTEIAARLKETRGDRRQDMHTAAATVMSSKLELLKVVVDVYRKNRLDVTDNRNKALTQMEFILACIMRNEDRLTTQEIDDIQNEIARLSRMIQFLVITEAPTFGAALGKNPMLEGLRMKVNRIIFGILPFTNAFDQEMKEKLTYINKEVKTAMVITESERKQIVSAMDLNAGHWFKCPNGHYYVITECGGAMEISACNECGARIGGTNHALLSSNRFAREMDGAAAPAWPTVLNDYNNYHLD